MGKQLGRFDGEALVPAGARLTRGSSGDGEPHMNFSLLVD